MADQMTETRIPADVVRQQIERLGSLFQCCRFNFMLDDTQIKELLRLVIQAIRKGLLPTDHYNLDEEDERFVNKMAEVHHSDLF